MTRRPSGAVATKIRWRIAFCASAVASCGASTVAAKTLEREGCRYEVSTAGEPTALAKAILATSSNPPTMQLDVGKWLDEANYNMKPDSVAPSVLERDPFRLDADGYRNAVWMTAGRGGAVDPGMVTLAKLMLMKQIESMPSLALDACTDLKQEKDLKDRTQRLYDMAQRLEYDVYRDPPRSEFVKRVQASRRALFGLADRARRGDAEAGDALRRLAAMAANDRLARDAIVVFDAFDAARTMAYARAKAGSTEAAYAYAALRIESHQLEDAREFSQELHRQASLQLLGQARGFLAVWSVAAGAMQIATDRDVAASETCGSADSSMPMYRVIEIDGCRADVVEKMRRDGR